MVKIDCNESVRSELIEIAQVFRAKVIDVSTTSMIIECTGNENKVRAFLNLIAPFGIKEMARTGNVALARGDA